VASQPGQGARFDVWLPQAQAGTRPPAEPAAEPPAPPLLDHQI
jgi:hypothetical protein